MLNDPFKHNEQILYFRNGIVQSWLLKFLFLFNALSFILYVSLLKVWKKNSMFVSVDAVVLSLLLLWVGIFVVIKERFYSFKRIWWIWWIFLIHQPALNCSKLTIETQNKVWNMFKVNKKDARAMTGDVLVSLLLTLNIIYILF